MKSEDYDASRSRPSIASRWLPVLKWLLFLVVVVFVARHAWSLWRHDALGRLQFNMGWLILAGCVYLVGWLPSVWYWRELLLATGGRVNYLDTARAYYCGHLGKFIPGKVMVLVIRAGLLKDRGSRQSASALTAAYETLSMMAVAFAVAVALTPWVVPATAWQRLPWIARRLHNHPYVVPAIVIAATIGLAPVLSRLLTYVAVKMASTFADEGNASASITIAPSLLLNGTLAFVVAWVCHGLSLGLTLRSLSAAPLNLLDWPLWIAAVSFATSVGFAVMFAPGGLGPREYLLMEFLTLHSGISDQQAVAAAFLLRVVWLAAEITAAAGLYYLVPYFGGKTVSEDPSG